MADGAQCCCASAPHPCRCHGSRPELHREMDAGHPAGTDGDTHAPPDGATVGPGRVTEAQNARLLADEFESVVLAMSEKVTTAADRDGHRAGDHRLADPIL